MLMRRTRRTDSERPWARLGPLVLLCEDSAVAQLPVLAFEDALSRLQDQLFSIAAPPGRARPAAAAAAGPPPRAPAATRPLGAGKPHSGWAQPRSSRPGAARAVVVPRRAAAGGGGPPGGPVEELDC